MTLGKVSYADTSLTGPFHRFFASFNVLLLLVILGKVSANYFICLQTFWIVCLVDSLPVFLIVQITAVKPMQGNWKRKKLLFSYRLSVGFLLSAYRPMQNNEKRKGPAIQLSSLGWVFIICLQTNARQWEGISSYSVVVSLAGSLLPAFRPMQDNGKR